MKKHSASRWLVFPLIAILLLTGCGGDSDDNENAEHESGQVPHPLLDLLALIPDTPENREKVNAYLSARELYYNNKLDDALKAFEALGEDGVSKYFIERIKHDS